MEPIIIPSSELREGDKFAFLAKETRRYHEPFWILRGDLAYHLQSAELHLSRPFAHPFAQVFERTSKPIGRVAPAAPAPGKYQRGLHDPAIAPSSMTGKTMPPGIKTLTILVDDQSEP